MEDAAVFIQIATNSFKPGELNFHSKWPCYGCPMTTGSVTPKPRRIKRQLFGGRSYSRPWSLRRPLAPYCCWHFSWAPGPIFPPNVRPRTP